MMNVDFKVCVRCFTYNQSQYIIDTLDGFCMQQTDFPFVCCIVDDASTDGTQQVIRKYLEEYFDLKDDSNSYNSETSYAYINLAKHKENHNCFFVVVLLKENHYSNPSLNNKKNGYISQWRDKCIYEALCEGDDYWIDNSKLHKQVDYLEKHNDCGLVRTDVRAYYQSESVFERKYMSKGVFAKNDDSELYYVVYGRFAAPCTWVYRMDIFNTLPQLDSNKYFVGDILYLLHFSHFSRIYYLKEETAVYRILDESASHFKDIKTKYTFYLRNKRTRALYVKKKDFLTRMKFIVVNTFIVRPQGSKSFTLWCRWAKDSMNDFWELI